MKGELASNLSFLKNSTDAALAAFHCSRRRLDGLTVRLGQVIVVSSCGIMILFAFFGQPASQIF